MEAAGCSFSSDALALDGGRVPLRSSVCFLGGGETGVGDLFSLEEGRLCPATFSRGRSFGSGERCLCRESRSNEGVDFLPVCRLDFLSLSRSVSLTGDGGLGDRWLVSRNGERLDEFFLSLLSRGLVLLPRRAGSVEEERSLSGTSASPCFREAPEGDLL